MLETLRAVYPPVVAVIFLCQACTVAAILSCRKCRGQFVFQLIVNTTLADFLMALVLLLDVCASEQWTRAIQWVLGDDDGRHWEDLIRYQVHSPVSMAYQVQLLTMFLVAVLRYMAVCRPFAYRAVSESLALPRGLYLRASLIVVLWFYAFALFMLTVVLDTVFPDDVTDVADAVCCEGAMASAPAGYQALIRYFQRVPIQNFVVAHTFCWCVFIASGVCYVKTYLAVQTSKRQLRECAVADRPLTPLSYTGKSERQLSEERDRRESRDLAVSLMLIYTVFALGYAALVSSLFLMFGLEGRSVKIDLGFEIAPEDIITLRYWVLCSVAAANSLCNLFFYVWRIRTFRRSLVKLVVARLKLCWCGHARHPGRLSPAPTHAAAADLNDNTARPSKHLSGPPPHSDTDETLHSVPAVDNMGNT